MLATRGTSELNSLKTDPEPQTRTGIKYAGRTRETDAGARARANGGSSFRVMCDLRHASKTKTTHEQ